jgi:hypothetical protein
MNLDRLTDAFIECMCWAESGDPESPLGADAPDLADETRVKARELCADFVDYCERSGIPLDQQTDEQNGHDLWLTMQGHGAGFWDRGLGEVGDRLTAAAKTFSVDCYVGDDGLVYLQ